MTRDREYYRELAARYLGAETTPEEERELAGYLSRYAESGEEKALARLVALEHHGRQVPVPHGAQDGNPAAGIREEDAGWLLSDEGEREFDSIVSGRDGVRRDVAGAMNGKRGKWLGPLLWTAAVSVCAAAAALLPLLLPSGREVPSGTEDIVLPESGRMDALRIAGNIQDLMDMTGDRISSVSLSPSGDATLVTARLADGTSRLYVMTYNEDEGSASLIALNE